MMMMGGGPHEVAGGQITDDGEMTMCLLTSIAENNSDIAADADEKVWDFETVGY